MLKEVEHVMIFLMDAEGCWFLQQFQRVFGWIIFITLWPSVKC